MVDSGSLFAEISVKSARCAQDKNHGADNKYSNVFASIKIKGTMPFPKDFLKNPARRGLHLLKNVWVN